MFLDRTYYRATQMPTRHDVITCARQFLEVRWVHQGRHKTRGIDCAGLIVLVGRELGILGPEADASGYQRRTQGREFLEHFRRNLIEREVFDARPGDIMIFRDDVFPCHSAIVGLKDGQLTIIHAHMLRRKTVEEYMSQGDWMSRRVACFEYPGLED